MREYCDSEDFALIGLFLLTAVIGGLLMLEGYAFTIEGDNFLMWSDSQQKLIEVPCSLVNSHCETLPSILAHYGVEPIVSEKEVTASGQKIASSVELQSQER